MKIQEERKKFLDDFAIDEGYSAFDGISFSNWITI